MFRKLTVIMVSLILASGLLPVSAVAAESAEKDILSVELLDGDQKTVLASGVRSGDAFTVSLPYSTPQETVAKVSMGGLYLKVVPSAGATVAQAGGWSDTDGGTSLWPDGGAICFMELGVPKKFTVTAEDGTTQDYFITVRVSKQSYTIKPVSNLSGGSITASHTSAEEGETVAVTVTPNSGKKMTAGSLKYTQPVAGGSSTPIDETIMQFEMPAYNIEISCTFEDASSTPSDTGPIITAFTINGVSGAVNGTTGTITLMLPSGTSLKNLAPVIATKNVASMSPQSGVAMDFTNAVTYTLTGTDGSTRSYIVQVSVEAKDTSGTLWDIIFGAETSAGGAIPWWQQAENLRSRASSLFPSYW